MRRTSTVALLLFAACALPWAVARADRPLQLVRDALDHAVRQRRIAAAGPTVLRALPGEVVEVAGVVGEAMVAIVLAEDALEKLGGDSMPEILSNLEHYRTRTAARFTHD